jgi:hypothetical protein
MFVKSTFVNKKKSVKKAIWVLKSQFDADLESAEKVADKLNE